MGPEALLDATTAFEELNHTLWKSSAVLCIVENIGKRECPLTTLCEATGPPHRLHDGMLLRGRSDDDDLLDAWYVDTKIE